MENPLNNTSNIPNKTEEAKAESVDWSLPSSIPIGLPTLPSVLTSVSVPIPFVKKNHTAYMRLFNLSGSDITDLHFSHISGDLVETVNVNQLANQQSCPADPGGIIHYITGTHAPSDYWEARFFLNGFTYYFNRTQFDLKEEDQGIFIILTIVVENNKLCSHISKSIAGPSKPADLRIEFNSVPGKVNFF